MSEKRMFTRKVTDSDDFIALSSSAQALYLHLCQSADDDGFCNQIQMAMFKAHASVDDVKVLLAKRFVLQFESGVIVIKHWRMANALRKDRYIPTAYQDELRQLHIKENGSYTLDGCQMVAKRLPNGCQVVAVDKDSIDKNSLDKCIDVKDSDNVVSTKGKSFKPPTFDEVRSYIKAKGYEVDPRKFYDYFHEGNWKDSQGKPVRNWKQKIITWDQKNTGSRGKKIHFDYEQREIRNEDFEHLYLDLDKDPCADEVSL